MQGHLEQSRGPAMVKRRKYTRAERTEIGDRDGWICGICHDPVRLVERPPALFGIEIPHTELAAENLLPEDEIGQAGQAIRPRSQRPLSAVIDHITPLSNLQIAHYRCNALKHDGPSPRPEYARAVLEHKINGSPMPARVWQRANVLRPGSPAWRGRFAMLAIRCDRGEVAIEPWRLALRYRVWRARRIRARRKRSAPGVI